MSEYSNHGPCVGVAPALSASCLRAGHGGRTIIREASFRIDAGEIVALHGENGSGKSTLLLTIAGVLPLSDGELIYGGEFLQGRTAYLCSRWGVATVLQGGRVFSRLTVDEHFKLLMPPLNKDNRFRGMDLFKHLYRLADRPAGSLSGGERQILSLGLAVARNPRLMLLDEPCAGLEPHLADALMAELVAWARTQLCGVLLVEHQMDWMSQGRDRSLKIENGVVFQD